MDAVDAGYLIDGFLASDGFHCYFGLKVLPKIPSLCHNSSCFLEKPTELYHNLYLTGRSEFRGTSYAKKMENIAPVRDGDKGTLVAGYWCMEAYAIDKDGILWPLLIWPYSLEAEGVLSENEQVLRSLSLLDEYFGQGFGIYIFDRGFDRWYLIEPFLALKRHFIIRQRSDSTVILDNGV